MAIARIELRLILSIATATLAGTSGGFAQTAGSRPALTIQAAPDQSSSAVIRDPLGRPCLDVEAAARAETINPDMKDHVVSIKNNCAKLIKAKVCYTGSARCNEVVLQAYKRVDTILGSMKGVTSFRYTVTQR